MKKLISTLLVPAFIMLSSFTIEAQQRSLSASAGTVQVLQFHLEHRCVSCLKIEKFTKATLTKHFPSLSLTTVNVEEKKNEKIEKAFIGNYGRGPVGRIVRL